MSDLSPVTRRDLRLALLLLLAAAVCRLPRLQVPPEEMFDEVYHAKSALQYLNGEVCADQSHIFRFHVMVTTTVWVLVVLPSADVDETLYMVPVAESFRTPFSDP